MLKHFRSKVIWDRGITAWGGCVEGCETASDPICFIWKWLLLNLVGKHMRLCFVSHSLLPYILFLLSAALGGELRIWILPSMALSFSLEIQTHSWVHPTYNEKSWGYVEQCISPDWPWDWFSLSLLSSLMSTCWLIPEPFSTWNGESREGRGGRERGEKREEEREKGRGQVKQGSKWSWVNQSIVWKWKEWFQCFSWLNSNPN